MKRLLFLLAVAQLFLVASARAEQWHYVSVSLIVNQGGQNITTTVVNNRKFLDLVAAGGTPKTDLFIGFRDGTGDVAVVRISDKTVLLTISNAPTSEGVAKNGSNSKGTVTGASTVRIPAGTTNGFYFDTYTHKGDGTLKTVTRSVFGGSNTFTVKGTIRTTGKVINL